VSPGAFETLAVLTAFFGTGTFVLIGLRMFLTYRARRFAGSGEDVRRLTDAVEELRRDLVDTRADLGDLHERVDFAERLLTKARDAGRLDHGS
jgi:hypothetical protein